MSRFAPVTDGEDHDLLTVVMVKGNVCPLAEFDHPLAKLEWQLFHGTANLRMRTQHFHALTDCPDRACSRIPAFGNKKIMKTCHIQQGRLLPL